MLSENHDDIFEGIEDTPEWKEAIENEAIENENSNDTSNEVIKSLYFIKSILIIIGVLIISYGIYKCFIPTDSYFVSVEDIVIGCISVGSGVSFCLISTILNAYREMIILNQKILDAIQNMK